MRGLAKVQLHADLVMLARLGQALSRAREVVPIPALRRDTAGIGFKPATRVEALLYDVCVTYGFCLPPDATDELIDHPPDDFDAFVDAILVAEGFDPMFCDPQYRVWVGGCVREWIFDNGSGKGTKSGLPLVAA